MMPFNLAAFLPLAILLGTALTAVSISAWIALTAPAPKRRAAPRASAEILPFPISRKADLALLAGLRATSEPGLKAS